MALPSKSGASRSTLTMRWAKSTATSGRSMSTIRTANSSPPILATVSPGRTIDESSRLARTRTPSPTWWPRVSLTVLNPSRSPKHSATERPERGAEANACSTRSWSSTRLANPVSSSWKARCRRSVLEGVALPVGRLEGPGMDLDLVGLPGDPTDEPHHPQVDEGEDGQAQPGHHRDTTLASRPLAINRMLGGTKPAKATAGMRPMPFGSRR